jgi:hypothetical protein
LAISFLWLSLFHFPFPIFNFQPSSSHFSVSFSFLSSFSSSFSFSRSFSISQPAWQIRRFNTFNLNLISLSISLSRSDSVIQPFPFDHPLHVNSIPLNYSAYPHVSLILYHISQFVNLKRIVPVIIEFKNFSL